METRILMFIFTLCVSAYSDAFVTPAHSETWLQTVCKGIAKSPMCLLIRSDNPSAEKGIEILQKHYFDTLDKWVRNPEIETIKSQVQATCAKLIFISATPEEAKVFSQDKDPDEWDFRVDFCTKATVNRVHPQPAFENKPLVAKICTAGVPILREVCRRSNL